MPSPLERRRNDLRTGVFVSVTLIIALAIIVTLSGVWRTLTLATRHYTVTYPVGAGVSNLKEGADVRVGGMSMGQVSGVRAVFPDRTPFETIAVDFTLDERVRLYSNAKIFVTAPLIGSDAWLDITDVGGERDESEEIEQPDESEQIEEPDEAGEPTREVVLIEEGGTIEGAVAVGMLSSLVGPDNADRTTRILKNATTFSGFLGGVPEEYKNRIVPVLENANQTMEDASATLAQVRDDYEKWRQTVDEVMDNVNRAADNLDVIMADARDMIEDNREDVDSFVTNMRGFSEDAKAISERVEGETIDKVHELLDRGNEGIDAFASVMEDVQLQLDAELPDVREALANARLASQQLKLTTIEVRRSPWKLLYRPSPTELEHELLYEAARSFAVAAGDLKAASDAMRRVMDRHGDELMEDREAFELLTRNLQESFRKYEQAQDALFGVLIEEDPQ
jgi:ABC-type transporter Mla subunit MlaD